MENYIVSARKYRPSTFSSVVGQKALTATLRNSISKERLAHAYLFCGSRGVGKTSCARIFAKTINCEHRTPEGEACNECQSCLEFNKGNSLNIIELDAASNNGVDDIRELVDQVQIPPVNAKYRVFIVDEVHMLTTAAFNAFLKTLEEPPSYVVFILATTEKHKIIPTILSRCQVYDFNRIAIQDMVEHLQYVASNEGITTEASALNVIARKADGAMRDALSIFDQVAASTMGNVTYHATIENLNILDYGYYDRLTDAFLKGDVATSLLIYKEIRDKGFDSQFFINGLASHFRDLMVARDGSTISLLEASDEARKEMAQVAARCMPEFLYKAMSLCNDADLNYRIATNKQLLVELTLIKLCQAVSPSPDSGAGEGRLRPITQSGTTPQQPASPVAATPASSQATVAAPARPAATQAVPSTSEPAGKYGAINVPPPPAATPRRTTLRTPGLSLKQPVVSGDVAEKSPTATRAQRNTPFTDEQFAAAWKAIIGAHPKEHLLVNAMRMASPVRTSGNAFAATVESEAIRDSIRQSYGVLIGELRDRLDNDEVTLDIALNKGQATSASLTDSEVYNYMRQKHSYLNTIIEDFHLTMS